MTAWFIRWIYMPESFAKAVGYTHEGSIFGAPAWIKEDGPDMIFAWPKCSILRFYAGFMDQAMEFACNFFPEDWEFVTPMTKGREL